MWSASHTHTTRMTPKNLVGMLFPVLTNDAKPDPKLIQVPEWTWNYERPINASNFTFVDMTPSPGGPSIAAVYTVTVVQHQTGGPWYQASNIVPCSVYAQRAPVDGWYEPTTDDQMAYSVADKNPTSCLSTPASTLTNRSSEENYYQPGLRRCHQHAN